MAVVNISKEDMQVLKDYHKAKKTLEQMEKKVNELKERYGATGEKVELVYRRALVARILTVETIQLELPPQVKEKLREKYGVRKTQRRLFITLPDLDKEEE
jgi:archaellum component FlaC